MSEELKNAPEFSSKPASRLNIFKGKKKILIITGSSILGVLLLFYIGFAIYFSSHFFYGTTINGLNCNGKTVNAAKDSIQKYLDTYILTIEERGSKTETLKSSDFGLKTVLDDDLAKLKKKQHALAWPVSLFKDYSYTVKTSMTYDESALNALIDSLDCMQDEKMTPPVNASLEMKNNAYAIVPEVPGTLLDKEKARSAILNSIEKTTSKLSLEQNGCYLNPTYTSESEQVKGAVDQLNTYLSANLSYEILGHTEVINKEKIASWLSWNENFETNISSDGVAELVSQWCSSYNTAGKPHTLNTSYGTTVTIDKGSYGWKIDANSTRGEIIKAIQNGEQTTKEPVYSTTANSKDVAKDYGNSYVEINLGTQHLFLYKDGSLVLETDFVSGRVTNGNATPTGIYAVKYKQSPAVLRGPGYASPVTYWMPFNGGVGLHDATWRNKFGGKIYYSNGSHGCINLPKSAAKTIYETISAGYPVIVYDEKHETEPPEDETLTPEEIEAANNEQNQNSASEAGVTNDTPEIPVQPSADTPADQTQPSTDTGEFSAVDPNAGTDPNAGQ